MIFVWGNHYFSRENQYEETKQCSQCGEFARLKSFDGNRWAHFWFIPIIPRGRVRVTEQCPKCERQLEAPISEWRKREAQATQFLRLQYGRHPENIEYALEALDYAAVFLPRHEAIKIANEVRDRFSDVPEAAARLTHFYNARGMADEGRVLLDKHSDPATADDEQNRQLAAAAIGSGDLAQAVQCLLAIGQPQADRDFFPLLNVGRDLFKGGRPREAYQALSQLFRWFPKAASRNNNAVVPTAKLEKQLGIQASVLPAGTNPNKDRNLLIGLLGLSAVGVGSAGFVLQYYQPLYLSNPLAVPVTIRVDGVATEVAAHGNESLTVAEGTHTMEIDLAGETLESSIEVSNGYFERYTRDDIFVVSVLGAEFFAVEEVIYTDHPEYADEPVTEVFGGASFYVFRDIDYPFEDPPKTIDSEFDSTKKMLYRVAESPEEILAVFVDPSLEVPSDLDPYAFASGQIRGGYHEPGFVALFVEVAGQQGRIDDARALLNAHGIAMPDAATGE